jgi:hypothetical protein
MSSLAEPALVAHGERKLEKLFVFGVRLLVRVSAWRFSLDRLQLFIAGRANQFIARSAVQLKLVVTNRAAVDS